MKLKNYPMEGSKDYKKIIEDYLNGTYSPEGEKIYNKWYESFDDEKVQSFSEMDQSLIKAEMLQMIKSNMQQRRPKQGKVIKLARLSLKVAAVFIGLLIIRALVIFIYQNPSQIEHATDYGQKLQITLPDQSVVVLNANSSIKYAKNWSADAPREVWIAGEAFFRITKMPDSGKKAQFIVHAENLNIQVLGTTFNVHHRRGDTKVVLNSGKVKLELKDFDDQEVIMSPGEMVEFDKNRKYTKKIVDPNLYNAWLNNQIVFENAEFQEIAKVLEDIYGYEVEIEDEELSKERFKGKFPSNKLKILIQALEESFNLKITAVDKKIIIKRKNNLPENHQTPDRHLN